MIDLNGTYSSPSSSRLCWGKSLPWWRMRTISLTDDHPDEELSAGYVAPTGAAGEEGVIAPTAMHARAPLFGVRRRACPPPTLALSNVSGSPEFSFWASSSAPPETPPLGRSSEAVTLPRSIGSNGFVMRTSSGT